MRSVSCLAAGVKMFHYVDKPDASGAPKVLLLQGPVGPFFRDLQRGLQRDGFVVRRVLFNAGDRMFADEKDCVEFSGSLDDWGTWLRKELNRNRPEFIVLFGARRPLHCAAKQIAAIHGIQVICLEEGYLRSGYVTCELGGNNDRSPLCNWAPDVECSAQIPVPMQLASSHGALRVWSAIYYLVRDLNSVPSEEEIFHRKREGVGRLAWSWASHMVARGYAWREVFTKLKKLQGELSGKYILVTLQMPEDSQLKFAARGWSNEKLIEETMLAQKNNGTEEAVVFKLHPLDRNVSKTRRFIQKTAKRLGLSDRVMVLNAGAIGEVVSHASGMIVINSTSAFSALHHEVPILVLGDAIYRHQNLVTVGEDPTAIHDFMTKRSAKCKDSIDAFIRAVKVQALLPGDFYVADGRKVAVDAISKKLAKELPLQQLEMGAA